LFSKPIWAPKEELWVEFTAENVSQVQEKARYFMYEEEPMYTKRESELLQQYIAQHGQMPEGNRELEDLF